MNTKFNPKEVPHWVRWIAVDEDGECLGFKKKPRIRNGTFNMWVGQDLHFETLYEGKPPKDYKDELYTWK